MGGKIGWGETRAGPWDRSICDCPCAGTNLAASTLVAGVLQLPCFIIPHELLVHSILSYTPS